MGSTTLKPVADLQGHRTKQELNARRQAQDALQNVAGFNATPPAWLDSKALAEWQRVVPLLQDTVPINNLDTTLLATYCQDVSDLARAQEHLNSDGYTAITGTGGEKSSPYVALKRQATAEILKLADALGLSVYGRLKMNIKGGQVGIEDPFAELLS